VGYMLAIVNGKVIVDQSVEKKVVLIEGDRILDICNTVPDEAEIIDAQGQYVSPGFIDIHIHGCNGFDIMTNTYESLMNISRFLLSTGVTGFLATTMTESSGKIRETIWEANRASCNVCGADILGIHMEGPFISFQYKGAQNPGYIEKPSVESFRKKCGEDEEFVKVVTLAPELEGAHELIEYLKERNIVASMGHTNADYEEAEKAIGWGVKSSTHTFNGMKGFIHREPGALGAVMDSDIMAEIIADGVHVHPAALRILARLKGFENLILVTDSMMAAGMVDGQYTLGGQKVNVKNGVARVISGQLAGSTLTMNRAVRNVKEFLNITVPQAVAMAAGNPARLLELKDRGVLAKGCIADIIIFNEDIRVTRVIKSGIDMGVY